MNQAEVEQWVAQQGGSGRVQYSRSTRQIDNPAADPMTAKNAGVAFDATADPKIAVSEEKWTAVDEKGQPTGAVLHVRRRPDGDFDIVDQANPNPARPGEQTPEQKNAAALQAQREKNAALPADQDPAYETDAERAKRAQDRIDRQGRDAETARQAQRQAAADAQAAADRNKPGAPTLKPDGKGGTIAVQAMPDGSIKTTPLPGVPSDKPAPERVPVNGVVYERQPDGTYAPAKGLPTESKPGSVVTIEGETYWATPNADPGQPPQLTHLNPGGALPQDDGPAFAPGMSPSDYLQQRRQWLLAQRRAGVSQKEVDTIWDRDVQTATARQNEANTQATQQNQRLSTSMTGFGQALTAVQDINKYLPQGSDLGGQALDAFLTLQRGQAQRSGGYGPTGPLAVPAAPTVADPSSQVAAIPQPPATYATAGPPPPPARALPAPLLPPRPPVTLPNAGAGPGEPPARSAIPSAQRPPAAAPSTASAGTGIPTGIPAGPGENYLAPDNVRGVTDTTHGLIDNLIGAPGSEPAVPGGNPYPSDMPRVSAIPESPYDFAARIAAAPPWLLSEDDHRKAQAMGLGGSFWATPGAAA